jgi:hypothetical protein
MSEKPEETNIALEHSEGPPDHTTSSFHGFERDGEIDAQFRWDFDIVTNLLALFTCFFASTWMLVTPSGSTGFITQAFPTESDKSIWIAAAVTIPKNKRPIVQGIIGIFAGIANCIGVIISVAFIKHNVGGVQDG